MQYSEHNIKQSQTITMGKRKEQHCIESGEKKNCYLKHMLIQFNVREWQRYRNLAYVTINNYKCDYARLFPLVTLQFYLLLFVRTERTENTQNTLTHTHARAFSTHGILSQSIARTTRRYIHIGNTQMVISV